MKLLQFICLMALFCFSSTTYATGVRLVAASWDSTNGANTSVIGNLLTVNPPAFFYNSGRLGEQVIKVTFRGCYSPPVGRISGTRNPHGTVVTPVTINVPTWSNLVKPLSGPTLNGGDGCLSGGLIIPSSRAPRSMLPKDAMIVLHGPGQNITLRLRINPPPKTPGSSPMLRRYNAPKGPSK